MIFYVSNQDSETSSQSENDHDDESGDNAQSEDEKDVGLYQLAQFRCVFVMSRHSRVTFIYHSYHSSWRTPIAVQFAWAAVLTFGMVSVFVNFIHHRLILAVRSRLVSQKVPNTSS